MLPAVLSLGDVAPVVGGPADGQHRPRMLGAELQEPLGVDGLGGRMHRPGEDVGVQPQGEGHLEQSIVVDKLDRYKDKLFASFYLSCRFS